MNIMLYLLMVICLFFDLIYIICKEKKKNIIGLIAKTIAALSFILIGYYGCIKHNSNFTYFVLLGLIFDGIGDILLALRNIFLKNMMFFIGSIFFLLGHFFYISAEFPILNDYRLMCIIVGIVIGSILSVLIENICHINKTYQIFGTIYLVIISLMASLSVGIYLTSNTLSNLVFMMGALLFMASDCILILYNFSKKKKWMHPVYSLLYFIAQILISYSLYLI